MGTHMNSGKVTNNTLPSNIMAWNASAGPYIASIDVTNAGRKNDGLPGDVLVGYFRPLTEVGDGLHHHDQVYFMIVNGLSATDGSAADTRQKIRVGFDFEASGINTLQRTRRDTGQIEIVPLAGDGGSRYHLDLTLDGGTGDLFSF
jgi:hypothetical protein